MADTHRTELLLRSLTFDNKMNSTELDELRLIRQFLAGWVHSQLEDDELRSLNSEATRQSLQVPW
jgi:hypothetical protein